MADKTGGKKEQKKKPRSKTEKPKYKTVNADSQEGGGGGGQEGGGQNQNIQKNQRKFQSQRSQGGQQGGNQFEPYLGPAEVQRGIQNGESRHGPGNLRGNLQAVEGSLENLRKIYSKLPL